MTALRAPRRDRPPDPIGLLDTAGAIAAFAARLAKDLPNVRHHAAEALRQAALIVTGSTLVITIIAFFAGGSCGLESSALARAFGAAPIAGGFSAWCTLREVVPFVFGYIVAAKVGCGMVAELSAMRTAEEIDALDGMGLNSLAYLAGTRFVGYGLRARGPVDVGVATARSMAISIVGVTLISMAGTLIFWGANPRIPIG
jgi:phospholipid/cholesterol/gamma-HCH transport system permease protein